MSSRIVVSGVGLCTPFAPDRESSWQAILKGSSAVRWLPAADLAGATRIAGAPVCVPPSSSGQHREPLIDLARTTATESINDARLDGKQLKQATVGVVFGTSKGGLHTFSRLRQASKSEPGTSSALSADWLDVLPSRAASAIRQIVGGYGPNLCPVAACATGLSACLRGAELIQHGDCDIVLAGSADASLQPAILSSFRRLGVLSREEVNAAEACRPFDRNRSGFVVGEGAACLVMERMDSALARGANIYAEWIGGVLFSDAFGLTQLDPKGASLERLLRELSRLNSPKPDYINLHGTGTLSNDQIESEAIRWVFGDQANDIACSSLKGGLGHLLGAAGSVELAATVLAVRDQVAPPTVNLNDPDPVCQLDFVAHQARQMPINHAWKLSLGFGGHLAGACLASIH